MIQTLTGILLVLLGIGLLFALLRSRDREGSLLMRFDDFAVVVMMGLIVVGGFFAVVGVTSGPPPAEAAIR